MVGSVIATDNVVMSGGDGQPETLAGVTVTLGGDHAMTDPMKTGDDGGFAFTGLRAGTYTVTISGYPEDVSFDVTEVEVTVEVGEVGDADFEGHFIRTSAIRGEVAIQGDGLDGVMVTLTGGPADEVFDATTDRAGEYEFENLRPGDYTVSISDFDARDYEFTLTSRDVSVGLGETETIDFSGVLLRTSGINGRVFAGDIGLADIAVTLSGAADATTTTGAGGGYAFSGLAAGDYTVSIGVDNAAYDFAGMTSKTVTLGDDDQQRVDFEGSHVETASVSGMLFIDELNNNDERDAGENALALAGVPVALVGPGVNDQRLSATGPDGSFMFPGLRAGDYQLVVLHTTATAMMLQVDNDVAYGGPANYPITLGVGEAASQSIPFNITHTTVDFSVSLRDGDKMGAALPGAMVTLYGANGGKAGSKETSDDGMVSIKVARSGTSGNMVKAGVSHDDYHVADGMTDVSWEPQEFKTSGYNENDIVNLAVNVSISGTTVLTDHPESGQPLKDWKISVMMGDDEVDAPDMLDDEGMASLEMTVESVPATFTFSVADNQDDNLDGGESYEVLGDDVTYEHDGLSLMGDPVMADAMEVQFITQTLKVYVHHERDQVHGYTGGVRGGDERIHGVVDLQIRHRGSNGRPRLFSSADWDGEDNSSNDRKGGYTFKHLPADADVFVTADAVTGYMLLDSRSLDAYGDEEGLKGGSFGDDGGWGHTVSLCPLQAVEPTGQDHDDCGSFAVVKTYRVTANVSKVRVRTSGNGFNSSDPSVTHESGAEISLMPVTGKNLGGSAKSRTTASRDEPRTSNWDERRDLDFGAMAAGRYELGVPDGWEGWAFVRPGSQSLRRSTRLDALNPLESGVFIEVHPSTAILYGTVKANDPLDPTEPGLGGVEVVVDDDDDATDEEDLTILTDEHGRYIISGVSVRGDSVIVRAKRAGYPDAKQVFGGHKDGNEAMLYANTATDASFALDGARETVIIEGTVTENDTGEPLKGVEIKVDNKAPLNAATSGRNAGKVVTGDDGTYTAIVRATNPATDPTVEVKPVLTGWTFIPASLPVSGFNGGSGIDFRGWRATRVTGIVNGLDNTGPMSHVTVTATWQGGSDKTDTKEDGTFSFDVPTLAGSVTIKAEPKDPKDLTPADPNFQRVRNAYRYAWLVPPEERVNGTISIIPGQGTVYFGAFTARSVQPRITKVERIKIRDAYEGETPGGSTAGFPTSIVPVIADRGFALIRTEPTDTVEVTWKYDAQTTTAGTAAGEGAFYAGIAEIAGGATCWTSRVPMTLGLPTQPLWQHPPSWSTRRIRTRGKPSTRSRWLTTTTMAPSK